MRLWTYSCTSVSALTEASSAWPSRSTDQLNTANLSAQNSCARSILLIIAFHIILHWEFFLWGLCNGANHKLLSSTRVFFPSLSFRLTAVKGIFIQFNFRHSVNAFSTEVCYGQENERIHICILHKACFCPYCTPSCILLSKLTWNANENHFTFIMWCIYDWNSLQLYTFYYILFIVIYNI